MYLFFIEKIIFKKGDLYEMKHKVIIKQVITTEIVVDANCADEALDVGNQILANGMIPVSKYQMEEGSVEVELLNGQSSISEMTKVS